MADYMQAPRRNALLGVLADATRAVDDYAQRPDSTMPMGKANALLSVLSRFAGVPAVASTLDRLSYGDSLTTGTGQTLRMRPEVVEAAMAAAPIVSAAGRVAGRGANALADASVRAITGNPQATAVNALAYARGMAPVNPLTVWHGSPHKFDRFDASKIGTGEGAQAYGHGIYVAESPDVARSYKDVLSSGKNARFDGKGYKVVADDAFQGFEVYSDNIADDFRGGVAVSEKLQGGFNSLYDALQYVKNQSGADELKFFDGDRFALKGPLTPDDLLAGDVLRATPAGNLYKVDLPDEKIARMLDWDKPLSQQSPEVQAALAKTLQKSVKPYSAVDGSTRYMASLGNEQKAFRTEKEALDFLSSNLNGGAAYMLSGEGAQSSNLLTRQGIPGIRYLDGGSRGAGGGTSNFVIFPGEENALTILERNGVPLR